MKKKTDDGKREDLSLTFELPDTNDGTLKLRMDGDQFSVIDGAGNMVRHGIAKRTTSHERTGTSKGPKVRAQHGTSGGVLSISGLAELAAFDLLFAIDTNYVTVGEIKLAVACFVPLKLIQVSEGYKLRSTGAPAQLIEMFNCPGNPELAAILEIALQETKVRAEAGIAEPTNIAFITDTELGLHDSINSRSSPMYEGQFLPGGFTLIYASSDTGKELANALIKACDKAATKHLKTWPDIETLPPVLRLLSNVDVGCRYFRLDMKIADIVVPFTELGTNTMARVTFEGDDGRIETSELPLREIKAPQ